MGGLNYHTKPYIVEAVVYKIKNKENLVRVSCVGNINKLVLRKDHPRYETFAKQLCINPKLKFTCNKYNEIIGITECSLEIIVDSFQSIKELEGELVNYNMCKCTLFSHKYNKLYIYNQSIEMIIIGKYYKIYIEDRGHYHVITKLDKVI